MKGLVTVDVEGGSRPDAYRSVDRLEKLLDRLPIPATLFVTPDVVKNRPETVSKWLDQQHAIGLHVHPERIGDAGSDWLTEYDEDSIEELVATGCATFADHLDFEPVLFRAGRWEYSDRLLRALHNQGFDRDASLRPTQRRDPYIRSGIEETPMTVYDTTVVRQLLHLWDIESISLHADAFLGNRVFVPGFYAVTWRLLHADLPYIMTSIHDYDVEYDPLRARINRYLSYINSKTTLTTIDEL